MLLLEFRPGKPDPTPLNQSAANPMTRQMLEFQAGNEDLPAEGKAARRAAWRTIQQTATNRLHRLGKAAIGPKWLN